MFHPVTVARLTVASSLAGVGLTLGAVSDVTFVAAHRLVRLAKAVA